MTIAGPPPRDRASNRKHRCPTRARPPADLDRAATVITAVIAAIALFAVALIALVTGDSGGSGGSVGSVLGQRNSGYGSAGGPAVAGGQDPSIGSGTSSEGRNSIAVRTDPPGQAMSSDPVPGPPLNTASTPSTSTSTSTSGSATSTKPSAAQLRATFPTPPGTKKVSTYSSLPKPSDEDWYVSTSSLAAVHKFYVSLFTTSGWETYIDPSVYRDSKGRVEGYFSIYHLDSRVTADLSLDANYLGKLPGTVLIRLSITDG